MNLRQMGTSFCPRKEEADSVSNDKGVCVCVCVCVYVCTCVCVCVLYFTIAYLNSEHKVLSQTCG